MSGTLTARNGFATSSPLDTSPLATLTSARSLMCIMTISPDTGSAISLLDLPGGPTHCNSPDGQTAGKSGPDHVRASRSALRGSGKEVKMRATSGPSFFSSLPSAALQQSLASRLADGWGLNGSPLFELTWKQLDMPSGPPICRLAASARRTSGDDCSGWPTPNAAGAERGGQAKRAGLRRSNLIDTAQLSAWPTPNTVGAKGGMRKGVGQVQLCHQVKALASWAAPGAKDGDKSVRTPEGAAKEAERKGWQNGLCTNAMSTLGPTSNGFPASTESGGQLAPAFSMWLQGFPPEWLLVAPTKNIRR